MNAPAFQGLTRFFDPSLLAHNSASTSSNKIGGPGTRGTLQRLNHRFLGARRNRPALSPTGKTVDSCDLCSSTGAEETTSTTTYMARAERVALAAQFQQIFAGGTADTGSDGETASVGFEQLTFDFFAEAQVEQLVAFQQRTETVADGLTGTQKETFLAASQRVAARFQMSVSISGSALQGYAGTAEGLQEASSEAFDRFMAFVDDLLGRMDEVLNEALELLNGVANQEDGSFVERITEILNEFAGLFGTEGEIPFLSGDEGEGAAFFAASVQLEFTFEYSAEVQVVTSEIEQADPLTLDLDGDGIELTHHSQGARFDLRGTGQQVTTAFVTGGDAFLAMDRNGNGAIDSGRELFGDQRGAANGFEELRKLDANGDGAINAADPSFNQLLLWRDDGDGQTEAGELLGLADAGIEALCLRYADVDQEAAGGNRLGQIASFLRTDGSRGLTADAYLNFVA